MTPLLTLLLFFTTNSAHAADTWKCTAESSGKKVALTSVDQGFKLNFPDAQHSFALLNFQDRFEVSYSNSSKSKKNFLRYLINCPRSKMSCTGSFDSSYNGEKTQRPLTLSVGSRLTKLLDKNKGVLEYAKTNESINLHFADPEISFRCSK